jgi:isoleucyl-tRNA synthetase
MNTDESKAGTAAGPNESDFAKREDALFEYWNEKGIFKKTLDRTKGGTPFVYYDGPPFATGLPHFGHLLPTGLKDAVPRYQTMRGRYVDRQWGWDCHGLPIENLIQKEQNLPTKKDIEAFGVDKFSEAASASVTRFDKEWKSIIPRMGRWVDMDHAYKTMNPDFSESGWWAFKTLFDKGLVYEGFQTMHISPLLETALSNMEVAQNYKDITDLTVYAKFRVVEDRGALSAGDFIVAWTTTPWTLPGNVALAVAPDLQYVRLVRALEDGSVERYVVAASRAEHMLKLVPGATQDEGFSMKGSELAGTAYEPLFPYYANDPGLPNRENGWKVYAADFVTDDSGTGVVHIAPAFGQDDLNLATANALPFIQHVSMDGSIKAEAVDFAGMQAKPKDDPTRTDVEVVKWLAKAGRLLAKEKVMHSYPHCPRTDAPLLNYAMSSWFIKVSQYRDKLVELNKGVRWVPEEIGEGRFGKWLENARDWGVSRARYWGAPLPIWKSEDGSRIEVIGSLAELKERARGTNRYWLMRHAQSKSNVTQTVSATLDPANTLTDEGVVQAKAAAAGLKDKGITRIYCSDFTRTRQTADVVAAELGLPADAIITDERLREFGAGEFDGKTWTEFHDYMRALPLDQQYVTAVPGGESYADVKRRAMDFIFDTDSKLRDEKVLVITHGITISTMRIGALPTQEDKVWAKKLSGAFDLDNAQVAELDFAPFPHNARFELDLHRPYVDAIEWTTEDGRRMRRIPDVFDTWYDSGSVPFAKWHYPFENKEEFEKEGSVLFPADFIAEGQDQTRGWFYTMLALNAPLFDRSPYKSVVVNGMGLAEDGQKMSKSKGNFPPLVDTMRAYSADALRYFWLSSPAVKAEDVAFSVKGVDEIQKKVIGRMRNVVTFLETYVSDDAVGAGPTASTRGAAPVSANVLDTWIVARLYELGAEVTAGMEGLRLDRATRPFMQFVDDLSTWYLRRSRDRFKQADSDLELVDRDAAIDTTRYVLVEFAKLIAPFMPYLAEDIYLRATAALSEASKEESVHLERWPEYASADVAVIETMKAARAAVSAGLELRSAAKIKVRQPLSKVTLDAETYAVLRDQAFADIVADELNVKAVDLSAVSEGVTLDTTITPELRDEGLARDVIRALQGARKDMGLRPGEPVAVQVAGSDAAKDAIKRHEATLRAAVSADEVAFVDSIEGGIAVDADGGPVTVQVTRRG